ncbi:MAG: poly-beta-1,6 N-acetyl-D-glucosamine export porin PgaA [Proteobacteria bacterium]|nr:poly-beta-1,6 N-acetyl-D-glucosamine export porin PgaA [Pseudomonadota bacterium]
MKLMDFLNPMVLLPTAICLFLGSGVSAYAAAGAAVRAQDRVQQSVPDISDEALRGRAVQRARSGDYHPAIDMLERLLERDPGNDDAFHDLLIVLGWAERDSQVVQLADRLKAGTAPVEVLETLAKSSRNIGDFEQAIGWYELTISRAPDSLEGHLGLALTYADLGQHEPALRVLGAIPVDDRNRFRVLSTKAYIFRSSGDFVHAIGAYDEILANDPDHRNALRGKILAMQRLLLPAQALDIANAHPGVLSEDELGQLHTDWGAVQIRWANQTATSKSLAEYPLDKVLDQVSATGRRFADSVTVQQRTRFDRIVALRSRQRMSEVVSEYEQLLIGPDDIPAYVLGAAAGAYLYLRQPEKAQELLLRALRQEPDSFALNQDLFYVYVDLEQHRQAMVLAEKLRQSQPVWRQVAGSRVFKSNPRRMQAEITAALALAFADRLPQSQARFEDLLSRAPHNTDLRHELATVYRRRGWTDRALFEYRQVLSVEPEMTAADVGSAHAFLDLRQYELAERKIGELAVDLPARQDVMRLRQRWERHNEYKYNIDANYGDSSGVQFGSEQYRIDGYFFVKPLAYRWRPFVHTTDAFAEFPEGDSTRRRIGAGIEYRGTDWLGSLELNTDRDSGGELGVSGSLEWAANDFWSVAALWETQSDVVPLRGHRIGVDADRIGLRLGYRASESRQVSISAEQLELSDGNTRYSWLGRLSQRVAGGPVYKLDLNAEIYAAKGSAQNVVYYNPRRDSSVLVTAINEWRTYRRYGFAFTQQLNIGFGYHQQKSFGTGSIGSLQYLANLEINGGLSLQFGVQRTRNVYDGEREYATFFTLAVGGSF